MDYHEDEGSNFLRKTDRTSPIDAASYPRRLQLYHVTTTGSVMGRSNSIHSPLYTILHQLKKRQAFHLECSSEELSDLCLLDSFRSDSCILTLCTKMPLYPNLKHRYPSVTKSHRGVNHEAKMLCIGIVSSTNIRFIEWHLLIYTESQIL
jgi:hypothetical protein